MTTVLSPLEEIKSRIDPYAGREVFTRLSRGTVADITPEDEVVMRWHGLYRQRPPEAEVFMMRLKLPGGTITADGLRTIARIAARNAHGAVTLTTRQDIELHWVDLASIPGIFAELEAAGITTIGACGDQVRNVVACPLAGIDPEEIIDTTPAAQALTAAFLANPEFKNLPRKFKIAVCGCRQRCVPIEINDIGLVATYSAQGQPGYALHVGGGLSVGPALAIEMDAWIAPEEVVAVVTHAVEIFREYGNRENRSRARLKHLLVERGVEWFRNELERRLGHPLAPLAPVEHTVPSRRDHIGVGLQREAGLCYIGIPVRGGRLSVAQLELLAEIAETEGQGRLRLTNHQNVLLPDLRARHLDAVIARLAAAGLPVHAQSWHAGMMACPGKELCNRALIHTKSTAARLADLLDDAFPGVSVSVRMSGCPNGCGQHAIADIGLTGALAKTEAGSEERFDLWIGGGAGSQPAIARRYRSKLRAEELQPAIGELVARFQQERLSEETFSDYARRVLLAEKEAVHAGT